MTGMRPSNMGAALRPSQARRANRGGATASASSARPTQGEGRGRRAVAWAMPSVPQQVEAEAQRVAAPAAVAVLPALDAGAERGGVGVLGACRQPAVHARRVRVLVR